MKYKKHKGKIGLLGLTAVLLIILKLCGAISWPWIWVLFPVWLVPGIMTCVFAFILIGGRIAKGKW